MEIKTKFNLNQRVFTIVDGIIHEGMITRLDVELHSAGKREIMYTVNGRRQYLQDSIHKTKEACGLAMLKENGLEITTKLEVVR